MNLFQFASAMSDELDRNSYKSGWHGCTDAYLLKRLSEEVEELRRALARQPRNAKEVLSEAADVANFAFMLADNAE